MTKGTNMDDRELELAVWFLERMEFRDYLDAADGHVGHAYKIQEAATAAARFLGRVRDRRHHKSGEPVQ